MGEPNLNAPLPSKARQVAGFVYLLFVVWRIISLLSEPTDFLTFLSVLASFSVFVPAFFLPRRWLWLGLALITAYPLVIGLLTAHDLYLHPHPDDNITAIGLLLAAILFALCAFLSHRQQKQSHSEQ